MTTPNSTARILRLAACALAGLAALAAMPAAAKLHPAGPQCATPIAAFLLNGKPLSYERVQSLPGAVKVAATGEVYANLLLPNGREAIYAVTPRGCARKTSLARSLR